MMQWLFRVRNSSGVRAANNTSLYIDHTDHIAFYLHIQEFTRLRPSLHELIGRHRPTVVQVCFLLYQCMVCSRMMLVIMMMVMTPA
jgi:hypothetical protein